MAKFQAYNKRNNAWVKYERDKGKIKILNVKEREPKKKFAGVPVRGQRRK